MKRPQRPAQRLRQTIDCMPLETRGAMLRAIASSPIIVGAYTDREGGICPMLAAHRNGGRTSYAAFASAWDRYTRAGKGPRRATEREVRTLRTMLEASIAIEGSEAELSAAITAHRASTRAREARVVSRRLPAAPVGETGERDRTGELERRHGWAWLRPFRRFDEYERAVREMEAAGAARTVRARVARGDCDRRPAAHG